MFQISSASPNDGGNFTCAPYNIFPASVLVTIMDSEGKSAAVHKDDTSAAVAVARWGGARWRWGAALLTWALSQAGTRELGLL